MSLFDDSLVEKNIEIPLTEKFLIDLQVEIENCHDDFVHSKAKNGIESVVASIEIIINKLKLRKEYNDLLITSSKYHQFLDGSKSFKFVTEINGDLYIVIKAEIPFWWHNRSLKNKGEIFITIDKNLRITKSKFKPF